MDFKEYQELAWRTGNRQLSQKEQILNYTLGLTGEAGEVANKVKKFFYHGKNDSDTLNSIIDEIGDVLWYISALASAFNIDLDRIAGYNINKLQERYPDGFKKAGENE